jgi:hypothetical protein
LPQGRIVEFSTDVRKPQSKSKEMIRSIVHCFLHIRPKKEPTAHKTRHRLTKPWASTTPPMLIFEHKATTVRQARQPTLRTNHHQTPPDKDEER